MSRWKAALPWQPDSRAPSGRRTARRGPPSEEQLGSIGPPATRAARSSCQREGARWSRYRLFLGTHMRARRDEPSLREIRTPATPRFADTTDSK